MYVPDFASRAPSFANSSAFSISPLPSMLDTSAYTPASCISSFMAFTAASCPPAHASASANVASPAVIITAAFIAVPAFIVSPVLRNAVAPPTLAASGLTTMFSSAASLPLSMHSSAYSNAGSRTSPPRFSRSSAFFSNMRCPLCASVTIAAFTCPVSAVTPSAKAAGHARIAAHSAMVSMDKKHFFI